MNARRFAPASEYIRSASGSCNPSGLAEREPRGHTDVVPHHLGQRREISFLFDLFAASHRVRALLGQTMADAGLRPDEYAIYSAVQRAGTLTIRTRRTAARTSSP